MLALSKQHLQQHALISSTRAAQATKLTQQHAHRKPGRDELLADFPLAPVSAPQRNKKKPISIAKTTGSSAFQPSKKREKMRLISASAVKRSKALLKKLPRPTLLEQAERSIETVDRTVEQRNLRLLTHKSERSTKAKEAMKKILLATTKPSKHAKEAESEEDVDDERDDFDDAEIAEFM